MPMNNPEKDSESLAQTFEIILFKIADFLFGAPAEQISRILNGEKTKPEELSPAPVDLGEIFLLQEGAAVDRSCLLEVDTRTGLQLFRVDTAEGFTNLNLSQIRKLPPLIASKKMNPSFWGLALLENRIVCLVDLDNLKAEQE